VLVNATDQGHNVHVAIDGASDNDDKVELYRSSEGEAGERWRIVPIGDGNIVTLPPKSVATARFIRP
jgi:hypothetical protein